MTPIQKIASEFMKAKHPVILCGAGVSTDSNIPDYRGAKGAYVVNKNFKPITIQYFMENERNRKRYWLRSYLGWKTILNANPNPNHFNITRLQYLGGSIVTQNVDSLHKKAGSDPLELHGSLFEVQCQNCGDLSDRKVFQQRFTDLNPKADELKWNDRVNPDGDAPVELDSYDFINLPNCTKCNGILKPRVVFFGENIDTRTRRKADVLVENSDFLLVIGSTLTTYSAFRFLHYVKERGNFASCINLGPTRKDDKFDIKIDAHMSKILPELLTEAMEIKENSYKWI
eukprot:NODE_36_length_36011_cov_1.012920.p15 type:complete len:286 gc:universal NODE_36_length_36011_cov_1.012920:32349-31492(-)